jgi:hypothetical protein
MRPRCAIAHLVWPDWLLVRMCRRSQLYLKGFSELSHEAQIITALGFFTKGDATTWACVKKEEALADKLRSWEVFASDVEARFSDPILHKRL